MAYRHKATGRFAKGGTVGAFATGGKVQSEVSHSAKLTKAAGLKTGGAVKLKTGGKVPALATGGRLDKRARGGGVGADKSPFSSAKLK